MEGPGVRPRRPASHARTRSTADFGSGTFRRVRPPGANHLHGSANDMISHHAAIPRPLAEILADLEALDDEAEKLQAELRA